MTSPSTSNFAASATRTFTRCATNGSPESTPWFPATRSPEWSPASAAKSPSSSPETTSALAAWSIRAAIVRSCKRDLEQYCLEGMTLTYNALERDGKTPTYGGYSERIVVDENYVLRIPDSLPLDAAAPLLCAGITLYSPLKHWGAGPGKNVAIVGMGGLGHIGVKIASKLGAEVTVLSQSLSKQADGKRFGAAHYYATSDRGTFDKLQIQFRSHHQHCFRKYRLERLRRPSQARWHHGGCRRPRQTCVR